VPETPPAGGQSTYGRRTETSVLVSSQGDVIATNCRTPALWPARSSQCCYRHHWRERRDAFSLSHAATGADIFSLAPPKGRLRAGSDRAPEEAVCEGSTASMLVDGEEFALSENAAFVFRRADADGVVGLDPDDMGISAVAGSAEKVADLWWVMNRSRKRHLLLDLVGAATPCLWRSVSALRCPPPAGPRRAHPHFHRPVSSRTS
jgi:hypothetical protein